MSDVSTWILEAVTELIFFIPCPLSDFKCLNPGV